jgi:hypothetical protein
MRRLTGWRHGRRQVRETARTARALAERMGRELAPPRGLAEAVLPVWSHPALLLSEAVPEERLAELVRLWNPAAARTREQVGDAAWAVGANTSWLGPVALDDAAAAGIGVDAQWQVAYPVAVPRSRMPLGSPETYPYGFPLGDEGMAWSLVRGLAARLGGAARLPGTPLWLASEAERWHVVYARVALDPSALYAVLP